MTGTADMHPRQIATGSVALPASYWELYGPDAPKVWKLQRSSARDGIRRLTALSGGDGVGDGPHDDFVLG
jgi:hypothetical protein